MADRNPNRDLTIVFHDSEGDGYVAECLEIQGCLAQGETEAEAMVNIQDAISNCLSVMFEDILNGVMADRNLADVTFTNVSKQATLRVLAPQFAMEESLA